MIALNYFVLKSAPQFLLGAFFLIFINPLTLAQESPLLTPETAPKEIRFLSYNLKNYLAMTIYGREGKKSTRDKPEEEKQAVVNIIASTKPDILGVCEIGTTDDLIDLQTRLKTKGIDLPYSHHTGGHDKTRKLALLSAYPIQNTNSQSDLSYRLNGRDLIIRRGILDVTLDLPIGRTHFIGVHWKSKREIEIADQALIRLNEAKLTRQHAEAIMAKEPDSHLIVYGDFNDNRRTPAVKIIKGPYRSQNYLEDLMLHDSRGQYWTHYWDHQHQYARLDYVLVSKKLKKQVDFKKSYILDPSEWKNASDHRPLLTVFEIPQK